MVGEDMAVEGACGEADLLAEGISFVSDLPSEDLTPGDEGMVDTPESEAGVAGSASCADACRRTVRQFIALCWTFSTSSPKTLRVQWGAMLRDCRWSMHVGWGVDYGTWLAWCSWNQRQVREENQPTTTTTTT